jgi:hypothetical protein
MRLTRTDIGNAYTTVDYCAVVAVVFDKSAQKRAFVVRSKDQLDAERRHLVVFLGVS